MIQFKYQEDRGEFETLKKKNAPLAQIILDLDAFTRGQFQKNVLVTHVFRTKAMQKKIYGRGTTKKSPHMFWRAVDIREWMYTKLELEAMLAHLKGYDDANKLRLIRSARSRTVWLHEVKRNGSHFHIQYKGPMYYNYEPEVISV